MALSYFDQFVELVHTEYTALDSPDVQAQFWTAGRLEVSEHHALPRVAWIRDGGTIVDAENPGPHYDAALGLSFSADYDDIANVQAHISAVDDAQADEIRIYLLAAAKTALQKHSAPAAYEWVTEQPEGAAHMQGGAALLVQTFTWRLLVPTRITITVTPDTLTHTGQYGETPGC